MNKRLLAAIGLAAAAAVTMSATLPAVAAEPQTTVINYEENAESIPNPERGWYDHTGTHYFEDGSGYEPLDPAELAASRNDGVTQIIRLVYLEKFADQPVLDADWLALLQADFETARESGVTMILRFAYALPPDGVWPPPIPYGDAPLEIVLSHIEQLAPLLQANADVIQVLQAGFIGLWGEWYYTDHFAADPADPGVLTETDWDKRAAVVNALLEALPDDRSIQLRTMQMKQVIFDVPTGAAGALTPDEAYTGTNLSRVGHHNDCLLASEDDFGTFLSDPITLDQDFLAADTDFVPMGGETCSVNPPRSEWPSASEEMARYHYSYLNRDYNEDVLDSWGEEGLAETTRHLGYRFVMQESRFAAGPTPTLEIDIRNEGWAAPYNSRPAYVVLDGANGSVTVPLDSDARSWAPGEVTTVSASLADVPAGAYTASLALPAAHDSTASDPRFAVQVANVDTWNAERGLNSLQLEFAIGEAAAPAGPQLAATGIDDAMWIAVLVGLVAMAGGAVLLIRRVRNPRIERARGAVPLAR